MRVLLVVRRTLKEMKEALEPSLPAIQSTIAAEVFEDNNGALQLANNQQLSSRTRYYHTASHHFWQSVNGAPGLFDDEPCEEPIKVIRIDTADQEADFLTKPLSRDAFEKNRLKVLGW